MSFLEELPPNKQELLKSHLQLVIEANKTTNLTRIDSMEEGTLLHIEDSLLALPEMQEAPKGLYADLGTGGGFPGIPLAVACNRTAVLVDSRQKKITILEGIIKNLGLEDRVETYAGRAELLARTRSKEFSVITARALAKLSVLMELASPLLKNGGLLICYKSHVSEEEMNAAKNAEPLTGMRLVGDKTTKLANEYDRRILTFQRTGKPKITLPRREGEAQRNPLGI